MAEPVIDWLLASDPAIRWQTMRDLLDAPESEWSPERSRVETEGWGARILANQDEDGQWDGGAFFPKGFTREEYERDGQPWTTTTWALHSLVQYGLDPGSEAARKTVDLIGKNSRWDYDNEPYWEGEVEECINGRTVGHGAYFGVDVSPIVTRLLGEVQQDGGWNCERANGSVRSSFHTTLNVLEGLLEFEKAGGDQRGVTDARRSGEEYLLQRGLMRRLSGGSVPDQSFLLLINPARYHYHVLRSLDYFRAASIHDGTPADPRLSDGIDWLVSRRLDDGTWPVDLIPRGRSWVVEDEGIGMPSPSTTLRALRVLKWWDR